MKRTKLFAPLSLLIVLTSCNGAVKLEPKTHEYFVLDQMQNSVLTEFYRGNEKLSELKETALDKSEENRAARAKLIYDRAVGIDSSMIQVLHQIRLVKKEMIKDKKEWKRMRLNEKNHPTRPFQFQLDNLYLHIPSKAGEKITEIKTLVFALRKQICQRTAKYKGGGDGVPSYFFNDPDILEFENYETFNEQINKTFEESNVAQDDKETIRKIYGALTKSMSQTPNNPIDGVELAVILTGIENSMLAARADAIALIRSRVGGECYSFDKIVTIVDTKDVCFAGDTIEVSAFIAAYDSYKIPVGIVNGERFSEMKAGIIKHKLVVPNQEKFILKGSLTIKNKSGVAKTTPFEKTIRVLPKEQ